LSSDPVISFNKIRKNECNGIHIATKNQLRADAIISYNWIEKNLEDGIYCEGEENFTRIEKKSSHLQQQKIRY